MARSGKTGGGPGTNQYQVRGESKGRGAGQIDIGSVDQLVTEPLPPDSRYCKDVWGTQCSVIVGPPDWSHEGHGVRGGITKAMREMRISREGMVALVTAGSKTIAARAVEHLPIDDAVEALRTRLLTRAPCLSALAARKDELSADQKIWLLTEISGQISSGFQAEEQADLANARNALLADPDIPESMLYNYTRGYRQRAAVLSNPNLSVALLKRCFKGRRLDRFDLGKYDVVSDAIAHIVEVAPDHISDDEEWYYEEESYLVALLCQPAVPIHVLQRAARGDNVWRLRTVAKHPATTPEMLTSLASSERRPVREVVAENPKTPAETLFRIALDDEDERAREAAYNNPGLPEHMRAMVRLSGK